MTSTNDIGEYNQETEMAGLYSGGVLGGLVIGSFGDLLNSEANAMFWYAGGAVLGAFAGAIAGRLFRLIALRPEPEEPSHTERLRRPGGKTHPPRSVV